MFKPLPKDKKGHILAGLFIYTVSLLITLNVCISLVVTIIIAIAKELYDYNKPNHTAEIMDALATISLPSLISNILLYLYSNSI